MVYYSRGRVEAGHSLWELPSYVYGFNLAAYPCRTIQPIENIPLNTRGTCSTPGGQVEAGHSIWALPS